MALFVIAPRVGGRDRGGYSNSHSHLPPSSSTGILTRLPFLHLLNH